MATTKRIQQQPDINEAYIPVRGGINAYTKSLNETTDTPIKDFYKASKVSRAIKQVEVKGYVKYPKIANPVDLVIELDDKGNRIITPQNIEIKLKEPKDLIDYEAIKKKLASHIKDVKDYYAGLMSSSVFLTKTIYYTVPPNNSPEFEAMAKCFKPEVVLDEQGNGGYSMSKIDPKKKDELLALIQKQPRREGFTINVLYEANIDAYTDTDLSVTPRPDDQVGYFASTIPEKKIERYTLLLDLVEKCGITPEGMTRQTLNMNGVERALTDTHAIVERILIDALAYMYNQYSPYELSKSGEASNLVDGRNNSFIMRSTNMSLYEAFESAIFNLTPATTKDKDIKEFNTIFRKYRTPQELSNASGLHLTVAEQSVMPFLNAGNDYREFQKYMITQIPLFYDLIFALQEYKRKHPNVSGEWVDVKELAKLIPRYEKDIKVKGSLRPKYRNLLVDSFNLLKLFDLPKEKATKENGNKIYQYYRIVDVKEIEVDTRDNVVALKLDFTPEYYALYSENVAVVGDGIRELDDPQLKNLGMRISDYYTCNPTVMERTTRGEPLEKKASELARWAGLGGNDKNPQRKYARLANLLNALVENGKIVGRWENAETGKAEIRGYGKGVGDIILKVYPSDNIQHSYITEKQRKASRQLEKTNQKKLQSLLKRFDKGYTNRETEAKTLGVTTRTLELMLSGAMPIPSEVVDIIVEEIGEAEL